MTNRRIDPLVSVAYNAAARTAALGEHRVVGRYWRRLWSWVGKHEGVDITTRLFGKRLRLTPTAVYPVYARRWATYNDPVVEVVARTSMALGRAADVVDVGAAMGDTAALVRASCGDTLGRLVCVEGDPVFASYLRTNTDGTGVVVVEALISDQVSARALVRNPVGTATATGAEGTPARRLDEVMGEVGGRCDVLKIDVDGYDGRVLASARGTIERDRPTVFFEWDPGSYERSGSDWHQPFDILDAEGYTSYIWFDKYGRFAHFMEGYDRPTVDAHARICLTSTVYVEWHYDVVALHATSHVDPVELAELQYTRHHKAAP